MRPLKVLNLYAGIGGNRKLWQNVEVTAVEQNAEIAKIYSDFFPEDEMIVGDAHEFLLKHFAEYDFIWSSPPCPTHSRARYWGSFREDTDFVYPDMKLWQEIIFLQHFAKNLWVVENVKPYYGDKFNGVQVGRHYFWSNFYIIPLNTKSTYYQDRENGLLEQITGFNLDNYKVKDKTKLLRNCVEPNIGLHVFNSALKKLPPMPLGTLFENDENKIAL